MKLFYICYICNSTYLMLGIHVLLFLLLQLLTIKLKDKMDSCMN